MSIALGILLALTILQPRSVRAIGPYPDVRVRLGAEDGILLNQGHRRIGEDWPGGHHVDASLGRPLTRGLGDVNGDGRLDDVYDLGVQLGSGDGRFGVLTTRFLPSVRRSSAFACGDLNHDGLADVAVASLGIWVYFGNPDGTLTPHDGEGAEGRVLRRYEIGKLWPYLRLIDLDRDDNLDLIGVSDSGTVIAYGRGDGAFEPYEGDFGYATRAAFGDFDEDGLLDVITTGVKPFDATGQAHFVLYRGRPGRMDPAVYIEVPGFVVDGVTLETVAEAADVDGDGHLDAIAGGPAGKLLVLPGRGDGTFGTLREIDLPEPRQARSLLVHDLDLDGRDDLLVSYRGEHARIYWGSDRPWPDFAEETFVWIPTVWYGFEALTGLRRAFVRGDANDDGAVDLSDAVTVLEQLFVGRRMVCGDASDVNDSSHVDLADGVYLLNWLFRGGPPPAWPYPEAGGDLTRDVDPVAPRHQGQSGDLGCSYETFHARQGYSPCTADTAKECPYPTAPFLQRIDIARGVILEDDP